MTGSAIDSGTPVMGLTKTPQRSGMPAQRLAIALKRLVEAIKIGFQVGHLKAECLFYLGFQVVVRLALLITSRIFCICCTTVSTAA